MFDDKNSMTSGGHNVTTVNVRVNSPRDQKSINTVAKVIPVYYVIIGRGAAAVIDHTTLRQSEWGKTRLKHPTEDRSLPVLHIGLSDPWLRYHRHGMGQPAYLLRMPGYHSPPDLDAETVHAGLSSKVFSASTQSELDSLVGFYNEGRSSEYNAHDPSPPPVSIMEGWVAAIVSTTTNINPLTSGVVDKDDKTTADQLKAIDLAIKEPIKTELSAPAADGFKGYRLLVITVNEKLEMEQKIVRAWKIDICSGAGRPRADWPEKTAVPEFFKNVHRQPWWPPERWTPEWKDRPVLHGMDGLTDDSNWRGTDRVLVLGGGGIGLNQVERAEDEKCLLDWVARNTLHDSFVLRRNDTVLLNAAGTECMKAGEGDAIRPKEAGGGFNRKVVLNPAGPRMRFGHYAVAASITSERSRLKIILKDAGDPPDLNQVPIIRDRDRMSTGLSASGYFDCSDKYLKNLNSSNQTFGREKSEILLTFNKLVISAGIVPNAAGEPRGYAKGYVFDSIFAADGRWVGMQAEGGAIRMLGAAARVYPGIDDTPAVRAVDAVGATAATAAKPAVIAKDSIPGKGGQKMKDYETSLPASAVAPGFIRTGRYIADANHFFDMIPNTNVNTMTRAELEAVLARFFTTPLNTVIAKGILTARSYPNNGITDLVSLNATIASNMSQGTFSTLSDAVQTKKTDLQATVMQNTRALSKGIKETLETRQTWQQQLTAAQNQLKALVSIPNLSIDYPDARKFWRIQEPKSGTDPVSDPK